MHSKQFQRYLSFLTALLIVLSLMPVSALATEDTTVLDANSDAPETVFETKDVATVPSTFEETTSVSLTNELQARIDAILTLYGIHEEMTDSEIANSIIAADSSTAEQTVMEMATIEEMAATLTETEIESLDTTLFEKFYNIWEQLFTPAPIATTVTVLDGDISIADSLGTGTASGGTVTITAKGSLTSRKTNTVTIANESDKIATLSFDFALTGKYNSYDFGNYSSTSGTYSVLLNPNNSITLKFESQALNRTATLTLKNFSLVEAATSSNVTIEFNSNLGSVAAAGVDVTSGYTAENVSLTEGIALVATANSSTFLGWIDGTSHDLLSSSASYTYKPSSNSTVIAAFASANTDAWFLVGTKYYDDLNEATTVALSSGDTVILAHNGMLPSNDYTNPSGVTLLIPFDNSHTLITNNMKNHVATSNDAQTLFRQLTMPSGASISVNGAISVSSRASRQMVGQVGPYGAIVMDEGSSISVENGAFLYAYGYIFAGTSGAGTITVKDGGTVYEDIMSLDYPGSLSSTTGLFNDYKIFPLRAFSIRNVEVPMTLNSGAKEYVFYCIYSGTFNINFPGTELVISSDSSSPFQLKEGTTLTKSYSGGKQYVKINGSGGLNPLSVTLQGTTISSKDTTGFPIPSGFDIELASGTITMGGHVIMTEGSKITIGSEATVEANGKNLYVLDATEDTGAVKNTDVHGTQYTQVDSDAILDVNGVLNAGATFYTSTSGACITSSEGGGKINIATAPADTKVYVKMSTSSQKNIDVTSAQLLNANGNYVKTAEKGAGTYYYAHGLWHKTDTKPIVTSKPTAPTCTKKGYTTHTCSSCDYNVVDSYVDATGHSYSKNTPSSKIVTEATCIAAATCYVQCDNCDYDNTSKTVAAGEANPNNHTGGTYLSGKVDATCTKPGYSGDTHCGGCKQKLSDGNTVSALGHTPAAAVQENVKKATCLESGSYDSVVYCGICGEEISRTPTEIPVLEHNYIDGKCSVCGQYMRVEIVATNIAVNDGLDMWFYVRAENVDTASYKAVVTKHFADDRSPNPITVTIPSGQWEPYTDASSGIQYLRFPFSDISAKEMTDNVEALIYHTDGTQVSENYSQTVQNYAITTLEGYMSNNSAKAQALKHALMDMLEYGASAQTQFNYNTGVPANVDSEGVLADFRSYITTAIPDCTSQKSYGNNVAGVTVSATNTLMFTFYFRVANPDGMYAIIKYTPSGENTEHTVTVPSEDFYERVAGSLYGVDVKELSIVDGRALMTCTLYNSDGTVVTTATDSIEGYAYRNAGKGKIFMDMMRFVDSAFTYFTAN